MTNDQTALWITIVAIVAIIVSGCAGAYIYEKNCIDIARDAAQTYERMFKAPAYVAIGMSGEKKHAQAYAIEKGKVVWLTTTCSNYYRYGYELVQVLAVGVDQELDTIESRMTFKEFNKRY